MIILKTKTVIYAAARLPKAASGFQRGSESMP
jgi:hypothetical protein